MSDEESTRGQATQPLEDANRAGLGSGGVNAASETDPRLQASDSSADGPAEAAKTEEGLTDDFGDIRVPTWYQLDFEARAAQLYYAQRRNWFDSLARWARMISLFTSTSAVVSITADLSHTLTIVLTAAMAFVSLAVVVFDFAGQQRRNEDLYHRMVSFGKKLITVRLGSASDRELLSLRGEFDEIVNSDPRSLHALAVLCVNQQLRAEGFEESRCHFVPWYQRITAQLFPWGRGPYPTIGELKASRQSAAA